MTSSGSLGLLFPPSIPLILYALVAQVSVDQLFLAGLVPGFLMIGVIGIYSIFKSKTLQIKKRAFQWDEAISALREAIWEVPLPFIILFGIYTRSDVYFEAAALIALLGFISTAAFCKFLLRGDIIE